MLSPHLGGGFIGGRMDLGTIRAIRAELKQMKKRPSLNLRRNRKGYGALSEPVSVAFTFYTRGLVSTLRSCWDEGAPRS